MGGFTRVILKDKSRNSIDVNNARLEILKVPRKLRFYGETDVITEYESFKLGLGVFPESQFPSDKIHNIVQFKKYWNTDALGEVFCPNKGELTLDTYFGRTSDYSMKKLGDYIVKFVDDIERVSGSFGSLVEKVLTKKQTQILVDKGLIKLKIA